MAGGILIRIAEVEAGSLAHEAGLVCGDRLVRINGWAIRDRLDFEFHKTDARLDIELERGGKPLEISLHRKRGRLLGIEPEAMRVRICRNDCVFCFVYQTPKGMRRSLYVKDEDYRYSFLDGHFTTLSNMGPADWQRVLEQRLSPLYISVHATDPRLRGRLLGNARLDPIVDQLRWLAQREIDFHTQVVVVPGWNDGAHLDRTLTELLTLGESLLSVSVVPVGLTAHRQGLPELRPLTAKEARRCLRLAQRCNRHCIVHGGRPKVFPSDEMYLLGGWELPGPEFYGDFSQYENGVGTLTSLREDFRQELGDLPQAPRNWSITLMTAPLAKGVQGEFLEVLRQRKGLVSEMLVCANRTFGESVTVTGLLCQADFAAALEESRLGGAILLPPNCLNAQGRFLDGGSPRELEAFTGRPVRIPNSFSEYFP